MFDNNLTPFQFDMALQDPVFYMMRRGILIDPRQQKIFEKQYREKWHVYQDRLDRLVGYHVNCGSPKQIGNVIYKDFKLPHRLKKGKLTTDEDALRSLLAMVEFKMNSMVQEEAKARWTKAFLVLKIIIVIRGIRKALSSYIIGGKNETLPDEDGRVRCSIAVGGTETMRFSHSKNLRGTGLNLATVPRSLRTMYIADEGYELAEFDLNRGESWVYAHLSLDPELMRIHHEGLDFHSETASAIQGAFGQTIYRPDEIARLSKTDDRIYKLRYLGKKNNHANSYRMGPFRAAEVVNEESDDTNITVTPTQMEVAQKLWRGKYFGIQPWWTSIDQTLESTRVLTTPFGRRRQFFGFMSDQLKKEATAYVPQSTSVDYLNRGMLRVFNELVVKKVCGLELLHQNHDSILVQYPAQYRDEIFPQVIECLTRTPILINGHQVTIPVEGSYGQNWKELTEWKG